jgi:hypothetical protein
VSVKFVRLLNDKGVTYDSYVDLFTLIGLSGFETIEQHEMNGDTTGTVIFPMSSGNAIAMASQKPRAFRSVCWQLERIGQNPADLTPQCFDEVWFSDRWMADTCRQNHPCVKYVPMGSHPEFGRRSIEDKRFDFAVMSYLHGPREHKINQLKDAGYTMAPNAWGAERDSLLASCRMGLCLHQWQNDPALEPLRATLFAAWHLPLVYEHCNDHYPYRVFGLDQIADAAGEVGREVAEENWQILNAAMPFRKCVEGALA